MKLQKFVSLLVMMSLLLVVSCDKNGGDPDPSPAIAVTGEYSELRANAVTLYGWCNQKEGLSAVYGFECSDTDLATVVRRVEAKSKDSSNKYSCELTNLQPGTNYRYCAYTRVNGTTFYGDEKSFTTASIIASVTAESSNVSSHTTTISGKLTVESEGIFTKSATLYYSKTASTSEVLKSDGTKKTLTLASNGEFSVQITALERKTKYYCVAVSKVDDKEFCSSVISFTTTEPSCPQGAVDLGLSVCWATCNLGASKPEEYGGYYQWADMVDVKDTSINLNWDNCPYHTGSNQDTGWTKYIPSDKVSYWSGSGSPDNKTVLDPEDDVAHVTLGDNWRMPTDEEWKELGNGCNWVWTEDYNGTGVKGMIFTGKKTGYTEKSIFLPAAGYRSYKYLVNADSNGYYWSSSLNAGYPGNAYAGNLGSALFSIGYYFRCSGLSVRPVTE